MFYLDESNFSQISLQMFCKYFVEKNSTLMRYICKHQKNREERYGRDGRKISLLVSGFYR